MSHYGVDLHHNCFNYYKIDEDKPIARKKIYLNDETGMNDYLNNLNKDDYIAVETTTNAFWFYDQVRNRAADCYVTNTRLDSIVKANKNDKIDAKKLSTRLKYYTDFSRDEHDFPHVYIPPKEVREIRSLFTTYSLFVKQRTMLKNRIYSLIVENGHYILKKDMRYESSWIRQTVALSESLDFEISLISDQIENIDKALDTYKNKILEKGKYFEKQIDILTSIKGVSVFIAIAIMADIGTIHRFPNAKKLTSYLRTAPRIEASNNSVKIKSVNKMSRDLALGMLLQGISHVWKSSPYLFNFYTRKCKVKKSGRTRIAVSRKLFAMIFHMLKDETYFYWMDKKNHDSKMKEYNNFLKKREQEKKSA